MTDSETSAEINVETDFIWPTDPPEDWWLTQGAALGLDDHVIRFAASLHSLGGVNARKNSQAAKLAGLSWDRVQSFRQARSVSVSRLLDEADKIKRRQRSPLTEADIDQKIDDHIRCPDALTVARGIELREKRKNRIGADVETNKMVLSDRIMVQVLRGCFDREYNVELWPVIWMEMILPDLCWHAPLLRQMAPYLKQHQPQLWEDRRKPLAQYRPDNLVAAESGPVLTASEIVVISLKNFRSLITLLDKTVMPEPRETARQDLVRVGLLEKSCA